MAVSVTAFPIPTPDRTPTSITTGPDGNIWFNSLGSEAGSGIGKIDVKTHAITDYPIPNSPFNFGAITAGPDGKLWFTVSSHGTYNYTTIGSIDPATGEINEFPLFPDPSPASHIALGIATGPDGNLWLAEYAPGAIGVFNPTTHDYVEYSIPDFGPVDIAAGPDGKMWFLGDRFLGSIDPVTRVIHEIPFDDGWTMKSIVAGPDGALWFTASTHYLDESTQPSSERHVRPFIGRLDPVTEAISEFSLPGVFSQPALFGIVVGPDRKLWFPIVSDQFSAIGVIDPTSHAITTFPASVLYAGSEIATAPNGRLWDLGYSLNEVTILPITTISGTAYRDLNANGILDYRSFVFNSYFYCNRLIQRN